MPKGGLKSCMVSALYPLLWHRLQFLFSRELYTFVLCSLRLPSAHACLRRETSPRSRFRCEGSRRSCVCSWRALRKPAPTFAGDICISHIAAMGQCSYSGRGSRCLENRVELRNRVACKPPCVRRACSELPANLRQAQRM
jgi:hypothetical protein